MQAVIIESGGQTACYISDLIPTSAHIDLTWVMAFDVLPLQTIESRKRYYAQSIAEKWLTIFTHDPNMPWAYVEKDERGKMLGEGSRVTRRACRQTNTAYRNACSTSSCWISLKHASRERSPLINSYLKVALKAWKAAPCVGTYPPATMLLSLSPPP